MGVEHSCGTGPIWGLSQPPSLTLPISPCDASPGFPCKDVSIPPVRDLSFSKSPATLTSVSVDPLISPSSTSSSCNGSEFASFTGDMAEDSTLKKEGAQFLTVSVTHTRNSPPFQAREISSSILNP
ncbi:hypothetical protein HanIR_Chr04g0194801 [Helianthus annuus]|nr:hypothetical protein HanIR_Chr11g0503821 [Helianthus annuus]KAJ0590204.1 hypothetical protein HanIR_Chr04g0194801 [Helianthus annuus]